MVMQIINGPIIPAGESLSGEIEIAGNADLVRITMPGDWDSAPLTFQISTDGIFFNDLFDQEGLEVAVDVQPGTGVMLDPKFRVSGCFIKFRSGLREHPKSQSMLREFAVAVQVPGDGGLEVGP
jgi:hypothetical protein